MTDISFTIGLVFGFLAVIPAVLLITAGQQQRDTHNHYHLHLHNHSVRKSSLCQANARQLSDRSSPPTVQKHLVSDTAATRLNTNQSGE